VKGRRWTATLLAVACLATGVAGGQDRLAKTFPPIDFARWARFIVRDFFDVQPYERVVIMADPTYYPELLDAIRAELLGARAIELGTILFDGGDLLARRRADQPRATDPEYRRLATEAMRSLYERADLFLWLPYRYGTGSERGDWRVLEHLVEGTNARGLHFHWIQGFASMSQDEVDAFTRMYEAALDLDYAALSAHQQRAIDLMRGRQLRFTTPLGTDLRVQVGEDSWFHKGDGQMGRERAARSRVVRDREMELPAGALRFVPDVGTTEGRLVVPAWGGGETVTFEFRAGRIIRVTAREGQASVEAAWARETGDKDRLAELVMGFNPRLPARGPGGRLPYYGYGAGVLRVALGDNWESGGSNSSSLEAWFYLTDATVTAGETPIVKDGRLVLR